MMESEFPNHSFCARYFPAEWAQQSLVQLTWPHENTDWAYMLDEVTECFINIAREITKREQLLIVTPHPLRVHKLLENEVNPKQVIYAGIDSNDTWARDHGGLTIIENGMPVILDFQFNGWGLKFAADKDNLITAQLCKKKFLFGQIRNCRGFVFEGGSIESDGCGTLMTTAECLLSPNRNAHMSQREIEVYLLREFGAKRVLWLHNGYLAGDDTDSHIDTLARLCPDDTIAYVKCSDPADEHFEALDAMEREIKAFRTMDGKPYRLLPLPMVEKIMVDGERLPATYANYLVINGAVLVPTYNAPQDAEALEQIGRAFPDREIVGIDCRALIRQHGSLHCVTMQYPEWPYLAE